MIIKELKIQRRSTYEPNPGSLYGSITVSGHAGTQEINLSGSAMAAILRAIESEVLITGKAIAKDIPVAFKNTTGELELIEHPLAQIEV